MASLTRDMLQAGPSSDMHILLASIRPESESIYNRYSAIHIDNYWSGSFSWKKLLNKYLEKSYDTFHFAIFPVSNDT